MGNALWIKRVDISRGMEPKLAQKVLDMFGTGVDLDRASSGKFISFWCKNHGRRDGEQVAADFWNNYSNKEGKITKQVLMTLETIVNPEVQGVILHSKKVILSELAPMLPPPLAELVYQFQSGMGGAFLRKWGTLGTQPGQLERPIDVQVSRGPDPEVFVLEESGRIQVFDLNGVFLREFPSTAVAIAVGWQEVFILNQCAVSVQVYSLQGTFVRTFGSRGNNPHEFHEDPVTVAISRSENVFVLCGSQLKVFNLNGDFARSIEIGWGPTTFALGFSEIFLLRSHQVVVMDEQTSEVTRSWGTHGSGNGQLWIPMGIIVSGQEVLISDFLNHRVQAFRLDGSYSKKWDAYGTRNGQFNSPRGLTVTPDGELFVADTGNNRIQTFLCCHNHEEGKRPR